MTELEQKIAVLENQLQEVASAKAQTSEELTRLKKLNQYTMSELFVALSEVNELINFDGVNFDLEVKESGTYAPSGDSFNMKFGKVVKFSHSVYLDANQKNIVSQYLRGLGSFDNLQFILV